jgi:hypothetical protein
MTAATSAIPIRPVRFNAAGRCDSPQARSAILDEAASGPSHIVVLAHGWNNTWSQALGRFTEWRDGTFGTGFGENINPLVIGLFWPSTWLTFGRERGPALAGGTDDLAAAMAMLPPEIQAVLRDALARGPVPAEEAGDLAQAVEGIVPPDDISGESRQGANAVMENWTAISDSRLAPVRREFGTAGSAASGPEQVAIRILDPRDLVRLASVWTMHDRARTVGSSGAAALLGDLLSVSSAPVHLVGHSYGCQLHLAAVRGMRSEKMIESALLLQPAVNYLCFSARLPGGGPSAYRAVLFRLRQPLLSTYSRHDFPLTRVFHRALRRRGDLGEVAAWPVPPSAYAALGGYGPGELADECLWQDLPVPAVSLPAADKRIYALDGSAHISGHGDVTNSACCGLLRSQLLAT